MKYWHEVLQAQVGGGFSKGDSAKPILPEVGREHGQAAVDRLIRKLKLDEIFGLEPGSKFEGGLAIKR